jgi:hypothetical protein
VSYQPDATTIRVRDTRTRKSIDVAIAERCVPAAAHSARVLVRCRVPASARYRYELIDSKDGSTAPLPGDSDSYDELYGMGAHWVLGVNSEMGHPASVYVNWRTGTRFVENWDAPVRDLDSPGLSPYKRRRSSVRLVGGRSRGEPLVLRRRGRRATTLTTCQTTCEVVHVSDRYVTWTQDIRVRLYSLRTGRRVSWRFPAFDWSAHYFLGAAQTRYELLVFAPASADAGGPYRVHALRLPR